MRPRLVPSIFLLLLLLVLASPFASAQPPSAQPDLAALRHLMDQQTADWNRGDLDAFATGYKNSPDILFVGQAISRGYAGMLQRYRKNYPNREAMGTLTFSDLEFALLDSRFATGNGHFHLARSAVGGGNAAGIFSLVFEKTSAGWKIIRDHTTAFATPKP